MNNTTSAKNAIQFRGISAFGLKLIALVCMTLDHIAAIGFENPLVSRFDTPLRTVGRIAAPIFLFLLVESIRHTHNQKRFLLRLWLCGLCAELFSTGMNLIFGEKFHYFTPSNILFTFFYTVLFVLLAERLILACKARDLRRILLSVLLLAAAILPTLLNRVALSLFPGSAGSIRGVFLYQGVVSSLLPAVTDVDYGIPFILLGIILYFAGTKKRRCIVFGLFCLFCIVGNTLALLFPELYAVPYVGAYFTNTQPYMFLALPFMLLYNGERGADCKWLFYLYYPLHREVLFLLFALMNA